MANEKQIREFVNTYRHFVREGRMVPEEQIITDLFELAKLEKVLRRVNENEANGWPKVVVEQRDGKTYRYNVPDATWQARDQKREIKTQERAQDIIAKYGFGIEFSGDPRGGAIRILLPNGASNNWGGTDWGIYW